ncbi:MAG: hypothetical protein Q8N76_07235 [Candidatus Omnitrophota bacterium]|nr:hypothetical protein [Candidatus Omnitrophota bacterium]
MKKLTAILIILVFSFEATGHCLPEIAHNKPSLRAQVLSNDARLIDRLKKAYNIVSEKILPSRQTNIDYRIKDSLDTLMTLGLGENEYSSACSKLYRLFKTNRELREQIVNALGYVIKTKLLDLDIYGIVVFNMETMAHKDTIISERIINYLIEALKVQNNPEIKERVAQALQHLIYDENIQPSLIINAAENICAVQGLYYKIYEATLSVLKKTLEARPDLIRLSTISNLTTLAISTQSEADKLVKREAIMILATIARLRPEFREAILSDLEAVFSIDGVNEYIYYCCASGLFMVIQDMQEENLARSILTRLSKISSIPAKRAVFNGLIEPLYFKNKKLFTGEDIINQFVSSYAQDIPEVKYLLFYANRDCPESLFPSHRVFKNIISKTGNKQVLVMHNVEDGQGDELIRNSVFIQALLDLNDPDLKIVVYSNRPYIYCRGEYRDTEGKTIYISSHDNLIFRPLETFSLEPDEEFDIVMHHYDKEVNYNSDIEARFQEYLIKTGQKERKDRIYLKTYQRSKFLYSRLIIGDAQSEMSDYYGNVYPPVFRLCAELGLNFRHGADKSKGRSFMTREINKSAERYWRESVGAANKEKRKTVVFNGFGGSFLTKGYDLNPDIFRNRVQALVKEGFFVIILCNGGTTSSYAYATDIVKGLKNVIIAPSPGKGEPETRDLIAEEERPYLYKYLAEYSDAIVTVEGGIMQLAYNIGKPFGVLMVDGVIGSGWADRWVPAGADTTQVVIDNDKNGIHRALLNIMPLLQPEQSYLKKMLHGMKNNISRSI